MPLSGTVIGRFTTARPDSADPGVEPDIMPLAGAITFTMTSSPVIDTTTSQVILATPIAAVLDENGYLITPVTLAAGIKLVASDDVTLNPYNFGYMVNYSLTFAGVSLPIAPHLIVVPAGGTVDLATVVPPGSVTPIGVAAAEAAALAAVAAANRAMQVILVYTGTEARIPGAISCLWVDLRVSPSGNPTYSTTNDIVLRPI